MVLEGINRTFRQHGLTTINAKPLDHVIAERGTMLFEEEQLMVLALTSKKGLGDNTNPFFLGHWCSSNTCERWFLFFITISVPLCL